LHDGRRNWPIGLAASESSASSAARCGSAGLSDDAMRLAIFGDDFRFLGISLRARLTALAKEDNEKGRLLSALSFLPFLEIARGNLLQLHVLSCVHDDAIRGKESAVLIPYKLEDISD